MVSHLVTDKNPPIVLTHVKVMPIKYLAGTIEGHVYCRLMDMYTLVTEVQPFLLSPMTNFSSFGPVIPYSFHQLSLHIYSGEPLQVLGR